MAWRPLPTSLALNRAPWQALPRQTADQLLLAYEAPAPWPSAGIGASCRRNGSVSPPRHTRQRCVSRDRASALAAGQPRITSPALRSTRSWPPPHVNASRLPRSSLLMSASLPGPPWSASVPATPISVAGPSAANSWSSPSSPYSTSRPVDRLTRRTSLPALPERCPGPARVRAVAALDPDRRLLWIRAVEHETVVARTEHRVHGWRQPRRTGAGDDTRLLAAAGARMRRGAGHGHRLGVVRHRDDELVRLAHRVRIVRPSDSTKPLAALRLQLDRRCERGTSRRELPVRPRPAARARRGGACRRPYPTTLAGRQGARLERHRVNWTDVRLKSVAAPCRLANHRFRARAGGSPLAQESTCTFPPVSSSPCCRGRRHAPAAAGPAAADAPDDPRSAHGQRQRSKAYTALTSPRPAGAGTGRKIG